MKISLSIIEKTTKEIVDIFLKELRDDGMIMPWDLEDKELTRIYISKYDNGDVCITLISLDNEGKNGFFYLIIKENTILFTNNIDNVDKTLKAVPGVEPLLILERSSIVLPTDIIKNDDDFYSLVFIHSVLVNEAVNRNNKIKTPKIINYNEFEHVYPSKNNSILFKECTKNILNVFGFYNVDIVVDEGE